MKIHKLKRPASKWFAGESAFTLIEVAFAAAVAALILAGMFEGYNMASRRAQFSACNLAGNAAAMRQLERIISSDWVPSYNNTALLTNNGTSFGNLSLPSANSNVITCTNTYKTVAINASAPYAFVQVQCSWTFPSYTNIFTNTVAVLRAPNL